MNILYISSFIYRKNSSAAIRNNKLIEGIVSLGHTVDVLTVNYQEEWIDQALVDNHKRLGVCSKMSNISSVGNAASEGGKKSLKKYLPKIIYNFLKNVVAYPDVDKKWLMEEFDIEDKYDFIISSSDTKTSHYIADKILKQGQLRAQWVQIWGDPWATDVNLDFLTKQRVRMSEHRLLSKANKIFYVSELTAIEYKNKYPNFLPKIYHVGRSFYKEVLVASSNTRKNDFIIFYPGSLNENRSISGFCKNIAQYNSKNIKKIKLRICGHQTDNIVQFYQQYDFIEFLGSKGITEVYSEFSRSDLLLFVDNGAKSTQIPGKIFDYYGTNLPILALVTKDNKKMSKFLSKDERTVVLNKNTQENIDFIVEMDKSDGVNNYYSPESVAKRFLDEL